jgi:hypothetical protein
MGLYFSTAYGELHLQFTQRSCLHTLIQKRGLQGCDL